MKINTFYKNIIIIALAIISIGLFTVAVYAALNSWDWGYRVNSGAGAVDVEIGNAAGTANSGQCGQVTNATGQDMFVPTRTTAEWVSVRDNEPAGATAVDAACCTPTNTDFQGMNCNNLCASMGGTVSGVGGHYGCGAPTACDDTWTTTITTNPTLYTYVECTPIGGGFCVFPTPRYFTLTACFCNC